VKLQILNLAVKLYLTNPKQTKLLCQYVFSLARYDQNYDIRDRARFLRQFIFPSAGLENSKLAKHAKKIFLATKPAPVLESKFKGNVLYNEALSKCNEILGNQHCSIWTYLTALEDSVVMYCVILYCHHLL
jgi:hypothetical protein